MKNELIVMTFSQKDDARKALETLNLLRDGVHIGQEASCIVEQDSKAQTIVHNFRLLRDSHHRKEDKVLDALIYALFEGSQAGAAQLAEAGLDEVFLQDVVDALQPDKSALLIYFPRHRLVDTRRVLAALGLLQGKVHHASFPDEIEKAILNMEFTEYKPG